MRNKLLCCDWGTSSFRLSLVQVPGLEVIGEVSGPEGIASTFNAWKSAERTGGISKEQFFKQQLHRQITALAHKLAINLDHIPVIISGMASSSIGLEELPYAEVPFALDGSQATIRFFKEQADFLHEIFLVSGIRNQRDVMRGEETQLIGLVNLINLPRDYTGESIFIFPGTHSKHIKVREQLVIDFHTFMTGELFNLLSQHSILKDSIESTGNGEPGEEDLAGFSRGVQESGNASILNTLFSVRTNQLFNNLSKKQNFFYLSGLLIGTELRSLLQKIMPQLILSSGSNLYPFYQLAIEELHLTEHTLIISPELIDKAALVGQVRIFEQQLLST